MSSLKSSSTIVFLTTLFKILAATGTILIIPKVHTDAFTFFVLRIQIVYNILTYAMRKAVASTINKNDLTKKNANTQAFSRNITITHLGVAFSFLVYTVLLIFTISAAFVPSFYKLLPEWLISNARSPLTLSCKASLISLVMSAFAVIFELACEPYQALASANNRLSIITLPEAAGSICKSTFSLIGFYVLDSLEASSQLIYLSFLLLIRPLAMFGVSVIMTLGSRDYFNLFQIYNISQVDISSFLSSLSSAVSTIFRSNSEELFVTLLGSKDLQALFVAANTIASFITRYYVDPLEDVVIDVFSHFKEPTMKDDPTKKVRKALNESEEYRQTKKALKKVTNVDIDPSMKAKRRFVEFAPLTTFILLTYCLMLISGVATFIYGQHGLFLILASAPPFTAHLFTYLVVKTNADAYLRVFDAYTRAIQQESKQTISRRLFMTQFFAIFQAILIYSNPTPSLVTFILPTTLHYILRLIMSIRFIYRRLGAVAVVTMIADKKILRSTMIFLAVAVGVKKLIFFDCSDSPDSFVSRVLSVVSAQFILSTLIFAVSTLPLLYYCFKFVQQSKTRFGT